MSDGLVIIPSNGDGYVELARTRTGKLFKKHILSYGDLRHPKSGQSIKIDEDFASTLKKNFESGVCPIVQVPLANNRNEHSEDPRDNVGEVVDLQVQDKKIYAVIDVRDKDHADKFGKTYLGASAMLNLDYEDTKTGKHVGPTLLHSCVTNRPYVTDLEPYEEIVDKTVAATSDRAEEAVVLLTEGEPAENAPTETDTQPPSKETEMPEAKPAETTAKPSLEDLLTTLKTEHSIDVSALQAQAAQAQSSAQLSQTIVDTLTNAGVISLSNSKTDDDVSNDEVVGAVKELAQNNVSLTSRVDELERRDATNHVDSLVKTGFVLPAKKQQYVELKLSNPSLFDALLPETPIVKLSDERGKDEPNADAHKRSADEIARYAAMANGAKK